ncbi:nucleotide sugar transporter family [Anaeramoeba flamelloides]|uniref:Nucleotide sugar transporter family n=1 Tax=Anaeramoeba flamelloides TaxID=1746091 RepID=A0AAV8A1V6_9EUKA|nr:nucleotide sugar transporter family [Anaeramoeba flamelloides]KAJ6232581.1 nucleotide sugar transporter family [Anaeramoeba flamelloides]
MSQKTKEAKQEIKVKKESSIGTVIFSMLFYTTVSISMVFTNKFLLSQSEAKPSSFFALLIQNSATVLILIFLGLFAKKDKPLLGIPKFEYKFKKVKKILPVSACFVSMILFGNYCLKYVDVSHFMIARSLHLVINVSLTKLFFKTNPTKGSIFSAIVVTAGFIVANLGNIRLSLLGFVFGTLASLFSVLYPIFIKLCLDGKTKETNFTQGELLIYNNTTSLFLLVPLCLITGDFHPSKISLFLTKQFLGIMSISNLLSFCMSFSFIFQVKHTSPLTHQIIGSMKGALQTILAALIFKTPFSLQNGLGNGLIILGGILYAYFKSKKLMKKKVDDKDKEKKEK